VTVSARTVQDAALQFDLGPDLTEQSRPPRRLRAAE
jgi:hypothetical protein